MKIILSRKGCDSVNGGICSPVMPDGAMLSIPIPSYFEETRYADMVYKGKHYDDIIFNLKPNADVFKCHMDPDIRADIHQTLPKEWRPVFGQADAAESHLKNQHVEVGDIFIFFGWFRQTEFDKNGKLRYKKSTKDAHMMFGYLQIGEISRNFDTTRFKWHPHYPGGDGQGLYIASEKLIIDGIDTGLTGAGTFKYSDDLVLTMPGQTKSRWKLPDFFRSVNISCHDANSWKPEGYLQTVRIGQEFVVSGSPEVTNWTKQLILNNVDYDSQIWQCNND